MNNLKYEFNTQSEPSLRLKEMLEDDPKWALSGKGLASQIRKLLPQFSYATVFKWLNENSLPRSPEERRLVATTLSLDLVYWEYGIRSQISNGLVKLLHEQNPISALKHSNAVTVALNARGIKIGRDIDDDLLLRIQELVCNQSLKHSMLEPDVHFIESLLDLVLIKNKP